jgi:hypothetical protein
MPFTLTLIFFISGMAPTSTSAKRVYDVIGQPEEDTYVSATIVVFSNVFLINLQVNESIFATGKVVWIGSQLHVSIVE